MSAHEPSSRSKRPDGTVGGVAEKPDMSRMIAQMRVITARVERLRSAAIQTGFAILDYRLAETPLEDRPAVSWEVEREEFLRRLDQQRGDDGD